jgi:hypothetical protein
VVVTSRVAILAAVLAAGPAAVGADPPGVWWPDDVARSLGRAGDNRPHLEKALAAAPRDQRKGMAFLVAHMPDADLKALTADFLLANVRLACQARAGVLTSSRRSSCHEHAA